VNPEDAFVLSPLNGIVDNINGYPTYYFPWVGIDTSLLSVGLLQADLAAMDTVQSRALTIFQNQLGRANVRIMPVPAGLPILLASQSLHCTIGVIGRQD
jgi:hypothetical protein